MGCLSQVQSGRARTYLGGIKDGTMRGSLRQGDSVRRHALRRSRASWRLLVLAAAMMMAGKATAQIATAQMGTAQMPGAIAAPGEVMVVTLHAEGVQVYECKAGRDSK